MSLNVALVVYCIFVYKICSVTEELLYLVAVFCMWWHTYQYVYNGERFLQFAVHTVVFILFLEATYVDVSFLLQSGALSWMFYVWEAGDQ